LLHSRIKRGLWSKKSIAEKPIQARTWEENSSRNAFYATIYFFPRAAAFEAFNGFFVPSALRINSIAFACASQS
jgi:hypothetical protein